MADDLADLLPLFLREAGERLERLGQLTCSEDLDQEAARLARRELHALKGATRMMRLEELSELCHRGEGALDPLTSDSGRQLVEILDRLSSMVAGLAREESPAESDAGRGVREVESNSPPMSKSAEERGGPTGASGDVRIGPEALSSISDRCARSRVLTVAVGGVVGRIYDLAQLAERGVNEKQPEQILATLATSLRQVALDFETNQRTLQRLSERQLDELLALQVQPLKPYLLNLARHARELGRSMGKQVEVEVSSGESHLDRRIIEALKEAFLHLTRNSVDHGLESAEERLAAGKPEHGHLRLSAAMDVDRVRIRVEDDGRGVDLQTVTGAALRRGMITPEDAAQMDPDELLQLICLPGFSTRERATDISGRGVGLDAVAEAVREVGGEFWIASEQGRGTTFTMDVPVARRGERVLVVRMGQNQIALPASIVRGFRRVTAEMKVEESSRPTVLMDDRLVPVRVLSESFGDNSGQAILIEGKVGATRLAVVVDAVLGEEEVFIRPLPWASGAARVFDAMAVLGSGRPVPVVSPTRLALAETARLDASESMGGHTALRVLLVDDSHVTREMIRRLLEDGGFAVDAASGADEALTALAEREFDCLVTDIEMPGMDGLELTRHLRDTSQFAHLPVVVVSTRDRPEDRLAGLEAGADAYLTKQGLDARELVALVRRVGGGP